MGKQAGDSWATRKHPDHGVWTADERRQRASYVATRGALRDFLVPHRFEGGDKTSPSKLHRSQLGYGVKINAAWLAEILGHVRKAPTTYTWGQGEEGQDVPEGPLSEVWQDASLSGESWRHFFERRILEWALTSCGGLIIVDAPPADGVETEAQRRQAGIRPYLTFIPFSDVEDFQDGGDTLSWVKVRETVDARDPMAEEEEGMETRHVLYRLMEDGSTEVGRYNDDGDPLGDPANLGTFIGTGGRPTLPVVVARFGEHEEVQGVGAGLLSGLDDIVIDLYNTVSEMRESYRDACFSLTTYRGNNAEDVLAALMDGTRFVDLGQHPDAALNRVSADTAEVSAGLQVIDFGLRAWAVSAKRKAEEATERASARSGISLQAEFQLDLQPLLVEITETLDDVESKVLHLVLQFLQEQDPEAGVGVERDTTFQLEDEASRISRLVKEFTESLEIPEEARVRIVLDWLDRSQLVDLEEEIELEGGGKAPLREVLEGEIREGAEAKKAEAGAAARFSFADIP